MAGEKGAKGHIEAGKAETVLDGVGGGGKNLRGKGTPFIDNIKRMINKTR